MTVENQPASPDLTPNNNPTPGQQQPSNTVDLSAYFKDDEPGVFDGDKVAKLAKDYENSRKSASYFQSQYMKKEGIPETIDGYFKDFRPDSSYEKFMDNDNVKKSKEDLIKFAFDNQISPRAVEKFFDYSMKNLAKEGVFQTKTEEELQAEQEKANAEALKEVQPMLDSLNRTKEVNDQYITKFLDSPSVFNSNPKMRDYLEQIANDGAAGYMLITLMEQAFNNQGVPVITGSIATKDKAAFEKAYNAETDPVAREKLLKEFYGEK